MNLLTMRLNWKMKRAISKFLLLLDLLISSYTQAVNTYIDTLVKERIIRM